VNNGFKYPHRRDAENAEAAQRISNWATVLSGFMDRQPIDNAVASTSAPQSAMITADQNFEKQKRINASAGDHSGN
jgi:hypothetical protein